MIGQTEVQTYEQDARTCLFLELYPTVQLVIGIGHEFPQAGDLQLQVIPEVVAQCQVISEIRNIGFAADLLVPVTEINEHGVIERRHSGNVRVTKFPEDR